MEENVKFFYAEPFHSARPPLIITAYSTTENSSGGLIQRVEWFAIIDGELTEGQLVTLEVEDKKSINDILSNVVKPLIRLWLRKHIADSMKECKVLFETPSLIEVSPYFVCSLLLQEKGSKETPYRDSIITAGRKTECIELTREIKKLTNAMSGIYIQNLFK